MGWVTRGSRTPRSWFDEPETTRGTGVRATVQPGTRQALRVSTPAGGNGRLGQRSGAERADRGFAGGFGCRRGGAAPGSAPGTPPALPVGASKARPPVPPPVGRGQDPVFRLFSCVFRGPRQCRRGSAASGVAELQATQTWAACRPHLARQPSRHPSSGSTAPAKAMSAAQGTRSVLTNKWVIAGILLGALMLGAGLAAAFFAP